MKAAVGLLVSATIAAQSPEWGKLEALRPGDRIGLLARDRRYVEGRFQGWAPGSITLVRRQRAERWLEADVSNVRRREKGSRAKSAMWGALAGAAIVFPIGAAKAGYVVDRNNPPLSTRIGVGLGFGMYGAGIGAAVGALTGGTKHVTVYRAPEKKP